MRIVWRVRSQLSEFMAELEREMEPQRVLLGLPPPESFHWLSSPSGDVVGADLAKRMLHVPRIRGVVFDLAFEFPPKPSEAAVDEEVTVPDQHSTKEENPSHSTTEDVDTVVAVKLEAGGSVALVAGDEECAYAVEHSVEEDDAVHHEYDVPERVHASCDADTVDPPPDDTPSLSADDSSGRSQPFAIAVDQILRTHSKQALLIELEWARQALRDRRRYLSSRQLSATIV